MSNAIEPTSVTGVSVLNLAMGAISERVNVVFGQVMDNIMDVNTKAAKPRAIQLTITMLPDDDRSNIKVDVNVKASKLEPMKSLSTGLYITNDENGEAIAIEQLPVLPNQLLLDGIEPPKPVVLKLK